jgi:hypothetical protein
MIDLKEFKELEPDSTEWHILENAYLLNHVWEVGEDDARKAAKSNSDALDRLFFSLTPMKKRRGKISPTDMEEWFIDCRRDKPHEAIEYILKTEWVAKERYYKNPVEFCKHLARQLSRKSGLRDFRLPSNKWKAAIIGGWALSNKKGAIRYFEWVTGDGKWR